MTRRPLMFPAAVLLLAGLAALPACKKKSADTGGGGGDPAPGAGPGVAPPAAGGSSDYVLFAHLDMKAVLKSQLFADVKQAVAKAGAAADWDAAEAEAAKEIGVKPTDIDSVTGWITEVSRDKSKAPKYVVIVAANKPIDKSARGLGAGTQPDARGFYTVRKEEGLIHFPDAKTLVVVHPDLADKYLAGYAKSKTGWPVTAETTAVAKGHMLYATAQVDKVPLGEMFGKADLGEFKEAMSVRRVTVTVNLDGKTLNLAALASYPDAASAGKAKETVEGFLSLASAGINQLKGPKGPPELKGFMPAVNEAQRALKAAKVEVSGSNLTIEGSYRVNFDLGAMAVEATKMFRGKGGPGGAKAATNNLTQIGLALHNHSDATGALPVHAIGAKGQPLRAPNDKPLLSWRVALLPYLEQENLYRQFKLDEPWDSPNNKKLIPLMPKVYAPPPGRPGQPGYTHLQMVVGPNALSPSGMRIPAAFPDGMSNTIAVVEAAEPVVWTKPDDVMFPGKELPKDFRKKFGGLQPNGFNVLMWDGSTRFLPNTVSDRTLGLALNPKDGMPLGDDW